MATVNQILNQARAWLGLKESDGTHKSIIDIYNGQKTLPRNYKVKYTDSWCATFISALAIKCGATNIIPIECSCGKMIELAKSMGIWEENDNITPKPGYIIMYDWSKKDSWPDHVGIVEKISGKDITVIEGNKNNAVARRVIAVGSSSIRGYIIPKYSQETADQPSKPINYDPWVARLQAELNAQGYRDYEEKKLVVDGVGGKRTKSACPTVKKGAKGNITGLIQERLVSVGFSLKVDKSFGYKTKEKVKKFQRNRGLEDDGIVGKDTWPYLLSGKSY